MDFRNIRESEELRDWMLRHVRPWIPLGGGKGGTAQRLVPEPCGLRPHRIIDDLDRSTGEILPACFLGVNTTVLPHEPSQPASRRKATSSDESSDAAESDDGPPGFEFHQLGELEDYDDEDLHGGMEEMALGLWSSTGY
ncbi:hypothetical protein UCRNP2_23 [Neofusicoccum parvum UCRNP2]|uniref:Uncharacterized protein n=1 Tax=Botryosphaeria parva (strain UCR-NP2) TaxID=1287680 RepID=R1EZG8_BOTPV|nr:hypothetical protein UCRNP2_23 [Neofusicoccum parvum UCRNP2]